MSVESYIQAMPKVELHGHLIGNLPKETLMMFADQNEIAEQTKRFDKWLALLDAPDSARMDELIAFLQSWLAHPDNLVRAVYDVGVSLAKQNIKYVELGIPALAYVTGDLTFDQLLSAINDGRDRAERAWGIQMRWVITLPRQEARRADEVARWSTSMKAREAGVVALEMSGTEFEILDHFERAFQSIKNKDLVSSIQMTEKDDPADLVERLSPACLMNSWAEIDTIIPLLKDKDLEWSVDLWYARSSGWIKSYADYPFDALLAADLPVTLNAKYASIARQSLSDVLVEAVSSGAFSLESLETMTLNGLNRAHLPDETRTALMDSFKGSWATLRAEHLSEDTPPAE